VDTKDTIDENAVPPKPMMEKDLDSKDTKDTIFSVEKEEREAIEAIEGGGVGSVISPEMVSIPSIVSNSTEDKQLDRTPSRTPGGVNGDHRPAEPPIEIDFSLT